MANNKNIPCVVFGASGYAGVELAKMIVNHPTFSLEALFVSEQSSDANKLLSDLYPKYKGLLDFTLVPGGKANIEALKSTLSGVDQGLIFLATPHEFSHDIANSLTANNITVLDLSGGFRLQDPDLYPEYYGFAHQYAEQLSDIPYGLPEWNAHNLKDKALISLPGCYPTASQMAIKPLVKSELLTDQCTPVINAISGVSGAGRKAALATSFCELSLKPYNLFVHRHLPEICQEVGRKVIFTPHVANFDRGILATIVMQVKEGTTLEQINMAFESQYSDKPFVRLRSEAPHINDVAHTPYCDLYWQLNGTDLIVISAIDNVLKGASSQAIQCANIVCGLHEGLGLLPTSQTQGAI
ncbi:N-acetyl-gamma-glutamyl-phosphate reductase [uncultured Psychrosphaera sp.]|uniref:N-acetyl-gamma-glutamyl-phosphate reductase n=1 Tax=uncultured Psychrosphaera sp. TaxID=1403522 RepID=UPI0030FA1239